MYQEFFKYMLNIDELNEDNYEYLTQLYGKSKLEEFFDKFVNEMIVSKKFDMIDKIEYYIKNRKLERFNTLNINKVDPNLSIYFNDIKKYPLLSSYEERILSNKLVYLKDKLKSISFDEKMFDEILRKYNYNKVIKRDLNSRKKQLKFINSLNSCDEKSILDDYVNYLEIREILINSNLRFVVYLAYRYSMNNDLTDLIQVGNSGLIVAVDHYETDKNTKFITYAYYWIVQKIIRYLHKNIGEITLPYSKSALYLSLKKFVFSSDVQLTDDEKIDFVYKKIYNKLHNKGNTDLEIYNKAKEIYNSLQQYHVNNNIKYIQEAVYNEEESNFEVGDVIQDSVCVEDEAISYELQTLFKQSFNGLDKRLICIILMRNGAKIKSYLSIEDLKDVFQYLDDDVINTIYNSNNCYTLEEIGGYLNLTRERVRQLEEKAKQRLKMKGKRIFEDYI